MTEARPTCQDYTSDRPFESLILVDLVQPQLMIVDPLLEIDHS
jgi:hypothetical protein